MAIANYERYISTPVEGRWLGPRDPFNLAVSYRRLGELYEQKHDVPKAVANYSKFVELWKNADPELQPRVQAARQALARLQRSGG